MSVEVEPWMVIVLSALLLANIVADYVLASATRELSRLREKEIDALLEIINSDGERQNES